MVMSVRSTGRSRDGVSGRGRRRVGRSMLVTGGATIAVVGGVALFAPIDVVVPFVASHRRVFVGLGTVAGYLMVLAAWSGVWSGVVRSRFATLRRPSLWRLLHCCAYVAWPVALLHGLLSGRAARPWVGVSSAVCLVAVAVALVVRLSTAKRRVSSSLRARTVSVGVPHRRRSSARPAGGDRAARTGWAVDDCRVVHSGHSSSGCLSLDGVARLLRNGSNSSTPYRNDQHRPGFNQGRSYHDDRDNPRRSIPEGTGPSTVASGRPVRDRAAPDWAVRDRNPRSTAMPGPAIPRPRKGIRGAWVDDLPARGAIGTANPRRRDVLNIPRPRRGDAAPR